MEDIILNYLNILDLLKLIGWLEKLVARNGKLKIFEICI